MSGCLSSDSPGAGAVFDLQSVLGELKLGCAGLLGSLVWDAG